MSLTSSLDGVPLEVLEHIAFFTAIDSFLGPPPILPLLLTNRKIYRWLSNRSNPRLYGRIFTQQFDIDAIVRRLGVERVLPHILSLELQRRWRHLKQIRKGSCSLLAPIEEADDDDRRQLLFEAYFMILENEGKNERQLREYANIDRWLRDYWFHDAGASQALIFLRAGRWVPDTQERSLAMWIFWFMLRPANLSSSISTVTTLLKAFAVGAHKYNLTDLSWTKFVPEPRRSQPHFISYYSKPCHIYLPPMATPAILSFLSLTHVFTSDGVRQPTSYLSDGRIPRSPEWDNEWERCLSLGQSEFDQILTDSFRPGSVEGIWEGLFTYTEFNTYATLLGGGSPEVLQRSAVVRHRQTWKLREHLFLAPEPSLSELESDNVGPLIDGDPLTSYFPIGTKVIESWDGIEVYLQGEQNGLRYQRFSNCSRALDGANTVQDIIITGEGHSAWGQFNLVGRVRPCDGFISVLKEYVDGDRGKWLYRGYLVGNWHGSLAGRWRDTLSPAEQYGYEGCFAMSRRR